MLLRSTWGGTAMGNQNPVTRDLIIQLAHQAKNSRRGHRTHPALLSQAVSAIQLLIEERDEARRKCCIMEAKALHADDSLIAAHAMNAAEKEGWDCFRKNQ